VYRVQTATPAAQSVAALPLPDKPSIAVFPFQNISGDRDRISLRRHLQGRKIRSNEPGIRGMSVHSTLVANPNRRNLGPRSVKSRYAGRVPVIKIAETRIGHGRPATTGGRVRMKFIAGWSNQQNKWLLVCKKWASMSPQERANAIYGGER